MPGWMLNEKLCVWATLLSAALELGVLETRYSVVAYESNRTQRQDSMSKTADTSVRPHTVHVSFRTRRCGGHTIRQPDRYVSAYESIACDWPFARYMRCVRNGRQLWNSYSRPSQSLVA